MMDHQERKIIHVDMDAFYASVEQLDNPALRGKPLAVGGGSKRGVVAAASYEARKFGVRSAMSGVMAVKLCPHLIFVKPRFERYKEVSHKIRAIFFEYTDLVEPLSLDEAYLDVSENKRNMPSATLIASEIRQRIYDELGLRASAGISNSKFVAKVASDVNKPNGQKTIPPEDIQNFLDQLPIERFYGIGKVTATRMYQLGIFTGHDLRQRTESFLVTHFKQAGEHYYNLARGIHLSQVQPNRIRKSLAAEHTFKENLTSEVYMVDRLERIAEELEGRLKRSGVAGKTITLKIKYSDFTLQTRSKTLPDHINTRTDLLKVAKELLYQEALRESVRLLGISLSNLDNNEEPSPAAGERQLTFDF